MVPGKTARLRFPNNYDVSKKKKTFFFPKEKHLKCVQQRPRLFVRLFVFILSPLQNMSTIQYF